MPRLELCMWHECALLVSNPGFLYLQAHALAHANAQGRTSGSGVSPAHRPCARLTRDNAATSRELSRASS
eukprot:365702-Chlamydomonas_euryale.AAC.21